MAEKEYENPVWSYPDSMGLLERLVLRPERQGPGWQVIGFGP